MTPTLRLKSDRDHKEFRCSTTTTIGRDTRNSIVLDDAKVSRSHAAIRCMGDGKYYLMDMGSSNGSSVNGQRVTAPRPLADGDEIAIGRLTFIFVDSRKEPDRAGDLESAEMEETLLTAGASVKQVTTLVTDIRGYTSLSEKLSPNELAGLLSRWCQTASEVVEKNSGVVDKFIGDAVMARWITETSKVGQSVLAALTAAHELGREAEAMNAEFPDLPHPFKIGVGINTGEALLGTVGGGSSREFTALGDAVNVAFRLEAASKDLKRDVILGPDCCKCLPANLVRSRMHSVLLKGKEQPISVCALTFDDVAAWKSSRAEGSKTRRLDVE